MARPEALDRIFMRHARDWAGESTCQHLNVGAVLARDGRSIATGYNGAPPGLPHCNHQDMHLPYDQWERCTNVNHAEGNVLAFAARERQSTVGSTLYCTHSPCRACAGLLIAAGIVRVVWAESYRADDGAGLRMMKSAGVDVSFEPWEDPDVPLFTKLAQMALPPPPQSLVQHSVNQRARDNPTDPTYLRHCDRKKCGHRQLEHRVRTGRGEFQFGECMFTDCGCEEFLS